MRVAFVGIKRSPSDMPADYWPTFVRFHLELPWYYAANAPICVDIIHPEPINYCEKFVGGGSVQCITETDYLDDAGKRLYDVVVHWRRWHDGLYDPFARNVILSQDHSYSKEWKSEIGLASAGGLLDGILVFPTWHKENIANELRGIIHHKRLYEGMTLGVDTDVYQPMGKDPYHLLWASDPGRGLEALIGPFLKLWSKDRSYHLTVTYPDYVRVESVVKFSLFLKHPGVRHMPGIRNGPQLWNLFNSAGILPYSSTFPEPSSRCHRQAMAAGSLVLYPPNMGSPSQLIEDGLTGIVLDPQLWPEVIHGLVSSGRWKDFSHNARIFALSENWAVQAKRFYNFFSKDKK